MGTGDISVCRWLKDKERFADLFNGFVFEGKQVIQPAELEECDSESDVIVTDKNEKEKGVKRYRDVVMRWKKDTELAILACENQHNIHYAMPVRTMLYDSLSYVDQVQKLWNEKENQKTKEKQNGGEFLSQFGKDDRIYPVITIVFYYGSEEWNMNRDLYEMFRLPVNDTERKLMEKYIPNYHINLLDVERQEHFERFKTDLQVIFNMIKYRHNKDALKKYAEEQGEYLSHLNPETYRAYQELIGSKKLMKTMIPKKGRKGQLNMKDAFDEIYEDGVADGRAEGEAKGRAEGEAKLKIVIINMLNRGMDTADICALAECTPEFVEAVRSGLSAE